MKTGLSALALGGITRSSTRKHKERKIMSEEKKDNAAATRTEPQPASPPQAAQAAKPAGIGEAVGAGAFAGAVGGLAAHYFGGGKLTLPIFLVISIFLLGGLKGFGKFVGLVVFVIVAALVVVLFRK